VDIYRQGGKTPFHVGHSVKAHDSRNSRRKAQGKGCGAITGTRQHLAEPMAREIIILFRSFMLQMLMYVGRDDFSDLA